MHSGKRKRCEAEYQIRNKADKVMSVDFCPERDLNCCERQKRNEEMVVRQFTKKAPNVFSWNKQRKKNTTKPNKTKNEGTTKHDIRNRTSCGQIRFISNKNMSQWWRGAFMTLIFTFIIIIKVKPVAYSHKFHSIRLRKGPQKAKPLLQFPLISADRWRRLEALQHLRG